MSRSLDSRPTSPPGSVEDLEQGPDEVRRIPPQSHEEYEIDEKAPPAASLELRRTASNVLSRVASRLTTHSIRDPPPPPNGGLRAWTQVGCCWIVLFTTWGYVNSFGSFQTYYSSTLREAPSTISWIGSVQVWLTFFIGAFSGRMLDAGYFIPTFMVGMVLQALGIFLMSVSTEFWHLMLTQGILTGIGGGIFFTPSMGLLSTYWSTRRGMAVGIATTGNSAGGMIYPIIVRELLPKLGFAWTVRVVGFVNLACLCLVLAFMRPRLPPRSAGPVIDWKAFSEPVYMFFVGGIWFSMWANYWMFYYIASFGTDIIGLPYSQSTILIVILNGVGFPFRVIPPLFADRYGPVNTLIPILFAFSLVVYCWLAVSSTTGYYVFTVFAGIMSAAFQCLFPTAIASLTPNLSMVGTRLGMAFSMISFAALTGPPLGGALQSSDGGSFKASQIWAGTAALVCVGLVVTARWKKVGWSVQAKC